MWRGSERARKEILPTLTLHVVLPSVVLILFQLDTLESNSWKTFSERTKPHDWHVHMRLVYAYVCTKGGFFQIYSISGIQICLKHITNKRENIRVYLGVKTCEVFLCFLVTGYYFPWLYCVEFSVVSLYSLFYVAWEFHRFLHRGWAEHSVGCKVFTLDSGFKIFRHVNKWTHWDVLISDWRTYV